MLLSQQVIKILLERSLLSEGQYQVLLKEAKGRDALDLLQDKKIILEEDLVKIKGEVLNTPFVDLLDREIPPQVLNLIPEDIARTYKLVPWCRDKDVVSIAMVDPQNFKAIEALDFLARQQSLKFNYFITTTLSLNSVLRQYENLTKEVAEALKRTEKEEPEAEEISPLIKTAPVSKMVSVILRHAIEGEASDIHIEPIGETTRVRYRLEGALHTSLVLPHHVHSNIIARIKVLANLKLDETRLPQDGRFKMNFEGHDVEFRVSTLPLLHDEKVVLRILDTAAHPLKLEVLGFSDRNLEVLHEHLKKPHGMVLITGPTGCGKTTTLYALLLLLNQEGVNIITLEDPIEYNLPGIAQSQVKPEIGLTFAKGLRSVLRQDPNIIMVGEIRDNETADLAVHAALTGHLLLSTLHTNDAFGAIPRLIDMKIEPFLISSSLNLVVAQRLVRKICPECCREVNLGEKLQQEVEKEIQAITNLPKDLRPPYKFYQGKGCSHCDETGYKDRLSIAEILEITPAMQKLITSGEINNPDKVKEEFLRQGMLSMRQDGIIKVLRGLTTVEEVWAISKQ